MTKTSELRAQLIFPTGVVEFYGKTSLEVFQKMAKVTQNVVERANQAGIKEPDSIKLGYPEHVLTTTLD